MLDTIGVSTSRLNKLMKEPIASLEEYGLGIREINLLEDQLGIVYVRDLRSIKREQLLNTTNIGPIMTGKIQRSLLRYLEQEI